PRDTRALEKGDIVKDRPRTSWLISIIAGATLALGVQTLGPSGAVAATGSTLDLALCAPDRNTFTLAIDNPYFPLSVGDQWVLTGKEQGQTIGLRITVLDATENLYRGKNKVATRVVEETEWLDANANGAIDPDEDLIESSLNYFAQTQSGTVCYFGEAVDIYENGVVVSHEGSWRADTRGNAPGIFMPAAPEVGMTFPQEAAPGIAEDQVTIIATGTITVPAGTFGNGIKVRDFNPLDGSKGVKWYAPNVGLVVDGPLELMSH
ncbi:MAG TPA: hypothetical protein VHJ58_20400, partial [Vicinamibacterales bacterium]|nr:hypothetical protein [Vicinamibacterales bacterium]